MKFNSLDESHLKNLQAMVSPDRFSTGESVLDLHAVDQSMHTPSRPEAVAAFLKRVRKRVYDYFTNNKIYKIGREKASVPPSDHP